MKFYDNRFDFLRVNKGDTYAESAPSTIEEAEEYKDFILPYGENCVEGSTCLFVDKGDLFIYYHSANIYNDNEEILDGFGRGLWIKVSTESYESYCEGDNPYYSEDDIG